MTDPTRAELHETIDLLRGLLAEVDAFPTNDLLERIEAALAPPPLEAACTRCGTTVTRVGFEPDGLGMPSGRPVNWPCGCLAGVTQPALRLRRNP